MIWLKIASLILISAHAAIPPHGVSVPASTNSNKKEQKPVEKELEFVETAPATKKIRKHLVRKTTVAMTAASAEVVDSNLPVYLQHVNRDDYKGDSQVFAAAKAVSRPYGVRSGDIYKAVVDQEIVASSTLASPIRATVISGNLKGAFFVGEAVLDKELKRVIMNFTKIRKQDGNVYSVKASGLSMEGSLGLYGDYHSQTGTFFLGELASATAAGILDSTINRNQTVLGTYVQEPSLSNSTKNGAVAALSKTADRFAEQTKQAPEYTKIEGVQEIQIIIQDDPIELGVNTQ